ncbi:MAG TPA: hypothetical protein VGI32_15055 [Steroidobacteraceae bacterium]
MRHQPGFCKRLKWVLCVAALVTGASLTQQANAGCLDMSSFMKKTSFDSSYGGAGSHGYFVKTAYGDADGDWSPGFFHAPIVGLWAFKYIAEGNGANGPPNGKQIDGGNTMWFADGNEITYSAIRNPTTGATCLGVWKRTGRYTYELNHIGNSWDSSFTGPFGGSTGPAFIRQHIILGEDANSYTGKFEIRQLEKDGKTLMPGFPIKGRIEAVRVTVDTTSQTLPSSGDETM